MLVFDGDTGQLITAVLRPGNVHGSRFVVLVLRRLVRRLRQAWPNVALELRADSGCAVPRLYAWCEANAITYTVGLIPNPRLKAAYWLMDTLRRWLATTEAARYQFDTLRLRLLKIGGRVWERLGWARLALASSYPGEPLWHHLAARPGRS